MADAGVTMGSKRIKFRSSATGVSADSEDNTINANTYSGELGIQMSYTMVGARAETACQSFDLAQTASRSIVGIEAVPTTSVTNRAYQAFIHVCENNAYFLQHNAAKVCGGGGKGVSPMNDASSGCHGLMFAWNTGMNEFRFPPNVGIPVGPAATDARYLVLEVRYDNPTRNAVDTDDFKFRLFYNETRTANDAATMLIGDVSSMLSNSSTGRPSGFDVGDIPASTAMTLRQATCPGTCTSAFSSSINVIETSFHMHALGHKAVLQHYDSSKNLVATRARIDFWENTMQHHIQGYNHTFTLAAGESLNVMCYYDSSGNSDATAFGLWPYEEQCQAFLTYYPRQFRGKSTTDVDTQYSKCGYGINAGAAANECGSQAIDAGRSGGATVYSLGSAASDQIVGTAAYTDPENLMAKTSNHTCYPQGYPYVHNKATTDSWWTLGRILMTALIPVFGIAVIFYLWKEGYEFSFHPVNGYCCLQKFDENHPKVPVFKPEDHYWHHKNPENPSHSSKRTPRSTPANSRNATPARPYSTPTSSYEMVTGSTTDAADIEADKLAEGSDEDL
jgi:hypothetical protein